jgi:hypothetical protein
MEQIEISKQSTDKCGEVFASRIPLSRIRKGDWR